ncbi:type III-A CRISPR-associated protein Cas10/Csm1 [Candidatus Symbiobacter mobilis]|uniref:CRISPR system single-strand-specific deoxyribonuclease Cas10/Csm1 (subtype III-A) n=1 Tax=Candidatus Symbiobacter mobilis CR TaxID=946483 RepID=U5N9R3_9BURK|nr:type III-A CRISPR-associated protein Cas10/Csm1 [Candidatus Symbiobacter mobilis]AGX86909.1 hydrolase-like protein [Candidatus Symbiobacter mobilis CR]
MNTMHTMTPQDPQHPQRPQYLLAASCRVAFAALLHDLGKFAERARIDVPADALQAHITQFCPFHSDHPGGKNGYHSHKHAAYTGFALDQIEPMAPELIQGEMSPFVNRAQLQATEGQNIDPDSLINAAAAHHKPETFLQWIIATADRMASGFEREEFEQYNRAKEEDPDAQTGRNYYQARMLSLWEQIWKPSSTTKASLEWRYPLAPMSASALFPAKRQDCEPGDDAKAQAEYRALWQAFLAALQKIPASHRSQWPLWLDHFDTAWLAYTQAIPSATAFGAKPEVSLYDHCKATAALATALWQWHEAHGQTGAEAIARMKDRKDGDEKKFLLIQGDFFGIQDFVFSQGSETQKEAAKLLRGRSFQVSVFTELAALKVLEALSLPSTSQIVNAAGKFLIVAPNTEPVRARIAAVRAELDQWFLQHTLGMAGLGLAVQSASGNDLLQGRFAKLMEALFRSLESVKLRRFDLLGHAGPVLDVTYPHGACVYHGKLPADTDQGSAALSRDQIALGTRLTREERLLVVPESAPVREDGALTALEVPVFGYRVLFTSSEDVSGKFGPWAREGTLLRCWDFSLAQSMGETLWNGYARRNVNAYVPRYTDQDSALSDKYPEREAADDADWHPGMPKTFHHIASEDRLCDNEGRWRGQVALMTLKGDVDNLGSLFQQGLQRPSFAKTAALSRQMNAFFAVWLPAVCATEFPNTYTVFAGGDDFFLIGPWRSTQKLAARMAEQFQIAMARNPRITFSAGMVMNKPGIPIHALAEQAEDALDTAKGNGLADPAQRKNAMVLFGQRVRWPDWPKVQAMQQELDRLSQDYDLSHGYLYSLLRLVDLATDTKNPEQALWRSRFVYRTCRYVTDKLPPTQRALAQRALAEQLGDTGIDQLRGQFRIPLFNHFYSQR